ncbi:MAG: hypothetical protein NVS1B13_22840 [Flavisolibacter sp.]
MKTKFFVVCNYSNEISFLMIRMLFLISIFLIFSVRGFSQDNYEIQVYGSQTVIPKATMVELHSNFTLGGSRSIENGVLPTHHILHETIEITHGFTPCFEVGFYIFTAFGNEGRSNYVGSHIRPRFRVPDSWQWPVGVGLSLEAGYQKLKYSQDDWTLEIRPIVDKTIGRFYGALNPTFGKALHSQDHKSGYVFSPNFKATYELSKIWEAGFEYYGSIGELFKFYPYRSQQHQLFAVADVNLSPDWELNFGYGIAFTKAADNSIVKVILGYRIK